MGPDDLVEASPTRGATLMRTARLGALGAPVLVLILVAVLDRPDVPRYKPAGEARPLPAAGELLIVSLPEFEGVLVGQRGVPVVVNVWASWCAPCRTEMPLLNHAATAYADRVTFLGVASKDERDAAQEFLDELGVQYPNVFDATGDVRTRLGVTAYPTTYVFAPTGELRARVSGAISEQRLAALIEVSSR